MHVTEHKPSTHEQQLREMICKIGRLLHQFRMIDGAAGNVSVRLDANRILATPSGLAKGFMSPGQLIIVNMQGEKIGPTTPENADLQPTSELAMHLEVYRQRDDLHAVVHAHPPVTVALSVAGISLQRCLVPEAVVELGLVPTAPYSTPSSTENSDAIRDLIKEHDAIVLAYHGSLTAATDVWSAYERLEYLEYTAKIIFQVQQLGGGPDLPPEQVKKLLAKRKAQGFWRNGDEERFAKFCGCSSD
jgi:L-fuculose-phosphate aldolase